MDKEKSKKILDHFVEQPQEEPEIAEAQQEAPAQPMVDQKRNSALMRYIALLFGVAFIFVLLSFIISHRDSQQTISQLNENADSALTRVEKLQSDNRELEASNAELQKEVERLEAELAAVDPEMVSDMENVIESLAGRNDKLTKENDALNKKIEKIQTAYDLLMQAQNASREERWEDCATILKSLESLREHLDLNSQGIYDQLLSELEANQQN